MDIIKINEQEHELIGFASDVRDILEYRKEDYRRKYKVPPMELMKHDLIKQAIRWKENKIVDYGGQYLYDKGYLPHLDKFINSVYYIFDRIETYETENYPKHIIIFSKEFLNGAWVLRVIE